MDIDQTLLGLGSVLSRFESLFGFLFTSNLDGQNTRTVLSLDLLVVNCLQGLLLFFLVGEGNKTVTSAATVASGHNAGLSNVEALEDLGKSDVVNSEGQVGNEESGLGRRSFSDGLLLTRLLLLLSVVGSRGSSSNVVVATTSTTTATAATTTTATTSGLTTSGCLGQ